MQRFGASNTDQWSTTRPGECYEGTFKFLSLELFAHLIAGVFPFIITMSTRLKTVVCCAVCALLCCRFLPALVVLLLAWSCRAVPPAGLRRRCRCTAQGCTCGAASARNAAVHHPRHIGTTLWRKRPLLLLLLLAAAAAAAEREAGGRRRRVAMMSGVGSVRTTAAAGCSRRSCRRSALCAVPRTKKKTAQQQEQNEVEQKKQRKR